MSDNSNKKLKGFVEYLALLSDMISRMKEISETYEFDASKIKEEATMNDILADADPMIVGLLIKTIMRFRKVLDKPMENIDKFDRETINEFKTMIDDLKEKVLEEKE